MKKIILIVIAIVLVMCLSSCMLLENAPDLSGVEEKPMNIQEEYIEMPEAQERTKVIMPENDLVYINEEAGYQIKFPENWIGNYVITEYGPDEVCIGFYGESQTGQIAYKESLGRYGLDMAWVVSKLPDEGSQELYSLGSVNGTEYFLTTARGGSYLPELDAIADPDSISSRTATYIVDEKEIALAKQDLQKAIPMREDLYNGNIKFETIDNTL